jgi:uncharacterized protein (TIGR02147 family)
VNVENFEHTYGLDFREFLLNKLSFQCKGDKTYSLRRFASDLKVQPGTLSHVLSGKRKVTEKFILKLSPFLSLAPRQVEDFCNQARKNSAPLIPPPVYQAIEQDVFEAVSEWHYDAILELTHLKNFKPDDRWISLKLNVNLMEVRAAIDRLIRLDLLRISGDKWIDMSRSNTTIVDPNFTNAANRKYQRQILELSHKAVDTVPIEKRDHTSMTLTLRETDIPKIKKKIARFRRRLTEEIGKNRAKHDQVYQMSFSLFPLTGEKGEL